MLLRVPRIVVAPAEVHAEVNTGELWRLCGPMYGSHGSLVVTPTGSRSIPKPLLEKMELDRMALPFAKFFTFTPAEPLNAMMFPEAAAAPPTELPVGTSRISTPLTLLPTAEFP